MDPASPNKGVVQAGYSYQEQTQRQSLQVSRRRCENLLQREEIPKTSTASLHRGQSIGVTHRRRKNLLSMQWTNQTSQPTPPFCPVTKKQQHRSANSMSMPTFGFIAHALRPSQQPRTSNNTNFHRTQHSADGNREPGLVQTRPVNP